MSGKYHNDLRNVVPELLLFFFLEHFFGNYSQALEFILLYTVKGDRALPFKDED